MRISRKSWHYKISTLVCDGEPYDDNLCVYFWRLVATIALSMIILFVACTLILHYFTSPMLIPTTIMILFIVLSVVLPVWAIMSFRARFGSPEIQKANLLFEYIKSKKDKVCPLIEYFSSK